MENHDQNIAPEAATDEPASPPAFPSEEARLFYLQGLNAGLRAAARPGAAHPHLPARPDLDLTRESEATGLVSGKLFDSWSVAFAPGAVEGRHDGWTPETERRFLAVLAETGVVADACRACGMSRNAAYQRRNSAAGHAFALGWDAAILPSRAAVADDVMSRSRHGVIDRIYKDGVLVAERHHYDNRLTMAALTRLDRLAAGLEGRPEVQAIAAEYDRYLDLLPEGNAGAERFLAARFPLGRDGAPRDSGEAWSHEDRIPLAPGSERALLARHQAYEQAGGGLSREIPTDDLDPADMLDWTEEQLARAEHGGLLAELGREHWPAFFRPRMTAQMAPVIFVIFAACSSSTGRRRRSRDAGPLRPVPAAKARNP
ncbi:MAG: hypothetical protein QOD42_1153 [Sphingomonadales bacterium]|jgi:hypothetical protein|nr:hypothetical protein [Sphingomonadales bacterium]